MMTRHFFISTCLGISLLPLCTSVGHAADVDYLATSCPVVAVGTSTSRSDTATNVSFKLSIHRVLKGAAPETVNVSHNWVRGGIRIGGSPVIISTIVGIWCLLPKESGDW